MLWVGLQDGKQPKPVVIAAYVTAVRPGYEVVITKSKRSNVVRTGSFLNQSSAVPVEVDSLVRTRPSTVPIGTSIAKDWLIKRLVDPQYVACIVPLSKLARTESKLLLRSGRSRPLTAEFGNEEAGGGSSWATARGGESPQLIYPEGKFAKSFWREGRFLVILEGVTDSIKASIEGGSFFTVRRQQLATDSGVELSIFDVYKPFDRSSASSCRLGLSSVDGTKFFQGIVPVKKGALNGSPDLWRTDAIRWITARQELWNQGFQAEAYAERYLMEHGI